MDAMGFEDPQTIDHCLMQIASNISNSALSYRGSHRWLWTGELSWIVFWNIRTFFFSQKWGQNSEAAGHKLAIVSRCSSASLLSTPRLCFFSRKGKQNQSQMRISWYKKLRYNHQSPIINRSVSRLWLSFCLACDSRFVSLVPPVLVMCDMLDDHCYKAFIAQSVALWTRVTLQVWTCVKYVLKQSSP